MVIGVEPVCRRMAGIGSEGCNILLLFGAKFPERRSESGWVDIVACILGVVDDDDHTRKFCIDGVGDGRQFMPSMCCFPFSLP